MQCESCGAPLSEAKCLYCGRKSAEFSRLERMETNQHQYSNRERTEIIEMPIEQPQMTNDRVEITDSEDYVQARNKEQAVVKFLLCFFLGIFGAHYFFERRFILALIYLFTWGLFGIGWFIDCIRLLINLIIAFQNN